MDKLPSQIKLAKINATMKTYNEKERFVLGSKRYYFRKEMK